ncbi:MAG: 1-deoxy-D-xylulose-5-phosphate synthase [candidate division Zixibacteria bacterium]|nr:1-deoxy-D-xylulose-5-phosphate synthase [candidate division Zixibacteria bacterium]
MKHLCKINTPLDLKVLTVEELTELAEEIRQLLVSTIAETGGHLASNLGVVELTIALHYVYNLPEDKLVWDVSHQTYTHKILTGRKDRISTIRQYGGLAGYAKRSESEFDAFGAGHASTSISAALGLAVARDMAGLKHRVIAVIGDGAMTGGLAFEGLNNAGSLKKDLLVVLNDNTWSISKNVGSISKYLTSIMTDEKLYKLRKEIWDLTGRFKRRDKIRETISRLEDSVKALLVPGMLFEKLGFSYFGPIDGHDLPQMVKILRDIKKIEGPVLLHVASKKGKGFVPAEKDVVSYHGIGKFDKVTGQVTVSNSSFPSYTDVFGNTMLELASKNEKVVAITAAMCSGTGLDKYAEQYPDRFFDVGIAEGHAACFAAGLAAEGIRPYLAVYSTFMQRAYDQVIHDMAIQKLPVVICMDRGGLVGSDGPTHHGVFDLSCFSAVPNLTVAAPKDGNELRTMMHYTLDNNIDQVVVIRYPRDNVPFAMEEPVPALEWGKWEWLTSPGDIVVLAVGAMAANTLKARENLHEKGVDISVVNARFIKPLDMDILAGIARDAKYIITIEENALRGGFGQAVAAYLISVRYDGKFKNLGLADDFITHGTRLELLREVGLDPEGIARSIRSFIYAEHKTAAGLLQKLVMKKNGSLKKKSMSG